eukprot:UN04699
MTKPQNYNRRAEQLLQYFRKLIQRPKILKWSAFHKILNLTPELKKNIETIAHDMESKEKVLEKFPKESRRKSSSEDQRKPMKKTCSLADLQKQQLEAELNDLLKSAETMFMSAERNGITDSKQEIPTENDNEGNFRNLTRMPNHETK